MIRNIISDLFIMLLSLLVFYTEAATANVQFQPQNLVAKTYNTDGLIILAKGSKRPPRLKPKFKAAAKPKAHMQAPRKPVAQPKRSVSGRTIPKRSLASRVQEVSFPKQTKRLSASSAGRVAARKFLKGIKASTRALAKRPMTQARRSSALGRLHNKIDNKKTDASSVRSASIRGQRSYEFDKKSTNAIEHILRQHGHRSNVSGKSKFSPEMTPQKIRMLTKLALKKGSIKELPNGSHKITLSGLKNPVGKTTKGKDAFGISVIVRNGLVQSAHPERVRK